MKQHPSTSRRSISRRHMLAGTAAGLAVLGAPAILRAQAREIFVGGPASPGLQDVLFPVIEKKHNLKILFEGTNSLINLEKLRSNKAKPTMTVTMMDDPVLILTEREKLIRRLTPAAVPNLADVIATAKPRDAMWVNWCQPMCSFSHNTKALPNGLASYGEAWDKRFKDRIIMISMRITQAIVPLVAAAAHATGKPIGDAAMKEWPAGIERLKELRPNILQVSTNVPQAQQLLETGECDLLMSPDSRSTLFRKSQGAPVDQGYPKEGVVAMPAGVALVEGGPNQELGLIFINELLNPETQALISRTFFSRPTHAKAVLPQGLTFPELIVLDWEYFADNRNAMIERYERDLAAK
ncbi:MAG: extracellular solute-binding protein [Alphaproteobacteria bacterium]|nr:extracellular solute-binding protein [Alphaproteobacteria bacterium]